MRENILNLINQSKTKNEICKQLDITHQQFDNLLSIHNSNNYKNNDNNYTTQINYDVPKEKGLLDKSVDIIKIIDDNK